MNPLENLYCYKALIISVHDGDTVRADIDLGLGVWRRNESLRLARIDAPELSEPEGYESREYLRSALSLTSFTMVQTIRDKKEKYGRYLAEIWVESKDALAIGESPVEAWINVNDLMILSGHAQPYSR